MLAAESSQVGMGEVINIGGGRQISVNEVADLIDPENEHEYIDARLEPHDTLASTKRAKRLLGWQPEVKFEDGIAELLELYQIKKRPSA
jgi:UDP-glucose 4-epimerase